MDKNTEFQKLYIDYAKSIYRFCIFKLKSREEAEDITSDSFIKLYQSDFLNIENPKAWLFRTANNLMIDRYFRSKINAESMSDDFEEKVDFSSKSLEQTVLDEQAMDAIKEEIKKLDIDTSEVITLRVWEDLQFNEIAKILNISVDNAKKRFYRGIEKMKLNLSDNLKIKSSTVPFIAAGVLAYGKSGDFNLSNTTLNLITNAITSTLNINSSFMDSANTVAASSTAATTLTGVSAKTATAGFFSTTAAKIIIGTVGTASIVGGGVGGAYVINEYNKSNELEPVSYVQEEQEEEQNEPVQTNSDIKEPYPLQNWSTATHNCGVTYSLPPKESPYTWVNNVDPNSSFYGKTWYWSAGEVDLDPDSTHNNFFSLNYDCFMYLQFVPQDRKDFACGTGCAKEIMVNIRSGSGNGKTLDQLMLDFENQVAIENESLIVAYGPETHKITSKEKIQKWGTDVYKFNLDSKSADSGGEQTYYLVKTSNKFFLINSFSANPDSTNNQIAQTIIDQLSFMNSANSSEKSYSIFFYKLPEPSTQFSTSDNVVVATRSTNRTDVATFLIEELFKGPSSSEANQGASGILTRFMGESNCGGKDFTLSIANRTATLQFCKTATNEFEHGVYERTLSVPVDKIIKQFGTVDKVITLNKDGNCFNDASGINACLR